MIKINSSFDTLLDAAGKTLEVAPKLYDDANQPAAQESGNTLGLIPRVINAALVPMRQWIAHREYNMAETEKLLAYKLEHLDPEKVVSPEPYVAVPALQAISYSMNNDELRNLYANLLAKSMNSDTKDSVHPSFVEIIKQLSPLDARVFNHICNNDYNPLVNLGRVNKINNGGIIDVRNITLMNYASIPELSLSIDNLVRLKLIDIPNTAGYVDNSIYIPFYSLDIYDQHCKFCDSIDDCILVVDKKSILITEIGTTFHKVCLED